MKKVLALSIAAVMTVGIASHAFAAANPNIQLALDMQAKSKTRTCTTLASVYSSCSVINPSSAVGAGVGTLDVIPVVYNFSGITAVEFGLDWATTSYLYSPIWTKCSDLEITRVGTTDFSTQLVWNTCLSSAGGTSGKATGFVRLSVVAGPQAIMIKPADSGSMQSVDCQFLADPIHTAHHGGQGGAVVPGLAPCVLGPTATEQTTWSGVKALYR